MDGQALLSRLQPLMDSRSGVLGQLEPLMFPPGHEGQMHGFSVPVAHVPSLHPGVVAGAAGLAGYGTALDETTARVRACCEGLERYCSTMYPVAGVLVATAAELGGDALDPARLPQCSERERRRAAPEHRLRRPDAAAPERWVQGYSLTRGREAWIPLTAAYLGLPEPLTVQSVFPESTGFAAGSTFEAAVLSGLCEVIERDSLALWWLHRLPVPRLGRDGPPDPALDELLDRAGRVGIRTTLLDLTSDLGVPVVGLVQVSDRGAPRAVAMGACRTTAGAAALRVVEEAGSLRIALGRSRTFERGALRAGTPCSPVDFGLLYAGADGPAHFEFATRAAGERASHPAAVAGPDPLAQIVERLAAHDAEVFVVDVTLPEVRDVGIVVVRVVVPELMRISFSHGIRYLGHPRLYTAPERMGHGPRTEDMVTDEPIPFA